MQEFSFQILEWYSINGRVLPWREDNSPYRVLISEIMLQQTQVPRVIEKFHEFLELFPTLQDLANASKAEVIQAWSGLGYNRRALLLHKFAQVVCEEHNGVIPETAEELIKLPGIGPYAAGSVASFAFNKPEPAIDVNVRRIYLRYFKGIDQGLPMSKSKEKELFDLVKRSIPKNRSCDLHNALMDFGSLICLRKSPKCEVCVLKKSCKFAGKYELEGSKALFVKDKKLEKGAIENGKHTPNRIFRGRIVEFVRKNEGKKIILQELGKEIKTDFKIEEEEWLKRLLIKLEKDELIKFEKIENKVCLKLQE